MIITGNSNVCFNHSTLMYYSFAVARGPEVFLQSKDLEYCLLWLWKWHYINLLLLELGMVACACNPSTLEGQGMRIAMGPIVGHRVNLF